MQVEQAGPPNRPGRCLQENNRASQGRSRTRKRNRPSLPLEGSFLPRPTGKKPSRAFGRAPICRVTSGFPIEALTRSASTPTGASGAPRPAPPVPPVGNRKRRQSAAAGFFAGTVKEQVRPPGIGGPRNPIFPQFGNPGHRVGDGRGHAIAPFSKSFGGGESSVGTKDRKSTRLNSSHVK